MPASSVNLLSLPSALFLQVQAHRYLHMVTSWITYMELAWVRATSGVRIWDGVHDVVEPTLELGFNSSGSSEHLWISGVTVELLSEVFHSFFDCLGEGAGLGQGESEG